MSQKPLKSSGFGPDEEKREIPQPQTSLAQLMLISLEDRPETDEGFHSMDVTIQQLFAKAVAEHGERPALERQTRSGLEVQTYEVLAAHVDRLARWIVAQGGLGGERVALIGPNGPDWVLAALAVIHAGRVLVPLDMQFTSSEVLELIEHSEATALITSRRYDHDEELKNFPGLTRWPLEDLVRDVTRLRGAQGPLPASRPEEMAILLYTSGTSGAPKGVPMTHRNVTTNVLAVSERLLPRPTDAWLSLLPLSHGLELCMGLLAPLCNGASICYPRSRRPELILRAMRDSGTTVMVTVPAVLDFFARAIRSKAPKGWRGKLMSFAISRIPRRLRRPLIARLSGMPLAKVRGVVCGGAFLPPEIEDIWRALGLPIIQGYGLTEAGPVVSVNQAKNPSRSSAGRPLEIAMVRISQPGEENIGEIQVRSPGVMSGYFKNPEATGATFTEDGWLKTGDLGHIDDYGELHVVGRSKDVIITGSGLNVYPEEIEAKLQEHPLVRLACVVQRPIEGRSRRAQRDQDQVWAVVVLDEEALREQDPSVLGNKEHLSRLMSQVLSETNSRLAPYKRPAGAECWHDLPITRSGKVQRQSVRDRLSGRPNTQSV
jgi:long-chain acyl-CoA synthetase